MKMKNFREQLKIIKIYFTFIIHNIYKYKFVQYFQDKINIFRYVLKRIKILSRHHLPQVKLNMTSYDQQTRGLGQAEHP